MIPADFKREVEQALHEHFSRVLPEGYRRLGVYDRMTRADIQRSIDDAVTRTLPVYLDGAEREAARVGVAVADWQDWSMTMPSVDIEREGVGMSAREVRELVTAAVKAATTKPAVSVVEVESVDASGQVKKTTLRTTRWVQA